MNEKGNALLASLVESEKYYYDPVAAERCILFIEGYLKHGKGKFAGKPFKLLDWQKQLIRDVFGWKHRLTGLRRFQHVWIETAKGSGKTPLLAAIGIYLMAADNEVG